MGGGDGALVPVAVTVGVVTGISQPVFWFATFVMIAGLFFILPLFLADNEIILYDIYAMLSWPCNDSVSPYLACLI